MLLGSNLPPPPGYRFPALERLHTGLHGISGTTPFGRPELFSRRLTPTRTLTRSSGDWVPSVGFELAHESSVLQEPHLLLQPLRALEIRGFPGFYVSDLPNFGYASRKGS